MVRTVFSIVAQSLDWIGIKCGLTYNEDTVSLSVSDAGH